MLPHNCFYLDADCAARAMDSLYGYAILEDGIVLGSSGLAEWRRDNPQIAFPAMDGKFACVLRETSSGTLSLPSNQTRAETLRIRTDVTGQEFIYYILEGGFWAVSNSFALLVARASAKRSLSVYPPPQSPFTSRAACTWANNLRRLILWSKKCGCSQPLRRFAWIWAQITRKYSIFLLWIFL